MVRALLQARIRGKSAGLRTPFIMRRNRKPTRSEELDLKLIQLISAMCGQLPASFPLCKEVPPEIEQFLKRDPSAAERNAAVVRLLAAAIVPAVAMRRVGVGTVVLPELPGHPAETIEPRVGHARFRSDLPSNEGPSSHSIRGFSFGGLGHFAVAVSMRGCNHANPRCPVNPPPEMAMTLTVALPSFHIRGICAGFP